MNTVFLKECLDQSLSSKSTPGTKGECVETASLAVEEYCSVLYSRTWAPAVFMSVKLYGSTPVKI